MSLKDLRMFWGDVLCCFNVGATSLLLLSCSSSRSFESNLETSPQATKHQLLKLLKNIVRQAKKRSQASKPTKLLQFLQFFQLYKPSNTCGFSVPCQIRISSFQPGRDTWELDESPWVTEEVVNWTLLAKWWMLWWCWSGFSTLIGLLLCCWRYPSKKRHQYTSL